jgi:hypothetical protein
MSPKSGRDSVTLVNFRQAQATWPQLWAMGLLRLFAPVLAKVECLGFAELRKTC